MGKSFLQKQWILLTYFLLFSYLILIILTFLDYGITYDEDWRSTYGEYIIQWYASGFQDDRAITYWNLSFEGGFFNVITRLAARISPLGDFETSHLINAIFGLLGVVGAYKLGKLIAGPFAGFLSALFLVVTPRFYGHAFNNPKDIPMATLCIFSIYYLIRLVHCLPRVPIGLILKLGVVIGLALAVRIGAAILVGYVGIAFCLWFAAHYLKARKRGGEEERDQGREGAREREGEYRPVVIRLAGTFLAICAIAYVVMLIWWPAAQVSPIIQPARAFWHAAHFDIPIAVFFEGKAISNMDVPWYYVSKWILISLPEFYFIALAVGLALAGISIVQFLGRQVRGSRDQRDSSLYSNSRVAEREELGERELGISILLVFTALPIAYTILTSPVDYDGMRHFLFVIPPLAVIAAISVAKLVEHLPFSLKRESGEARERVLASASPRPLALLLSRLPVFASAVVIIAIVASVAMTVVDMWQLHPHQYIFFNRLFGKGLAKAARSFDTDYWGNSYKEGVKRVWNGS